MINKQAYFETLSEALDSENLLDLWDGQAIDYGQTVRIIADTDKKSVRISIYRSTSGRYERPIHYAI